MTTFSDALAEHLDALRARDIERFAATLSRAGDLAVVGPDGTIVRGYDAVRASHAAWFAMEDAWSFEPRELWRHESASIGLVLIDVAYRQTPTAEAIAFVLLLAFANERDGWRFVYDQNTPLAQAGVTAHPAG